MCFKRNKCTNFKESVMVIFILTTNKYNSFVELVNKTSFEFDYIDCKGYQVYLFKDGKLLNTFC